MAICTAVSPFSRFIGSQCLLKKVAASFKKSALLLECFMCPSLILLWAFFYFLFVCFSYILQIEKKMPAYICITSCINFIFFILSISASNKVYLEGTNHLGELFFFLNESKIHCILFDPYSLRFPFLNLNWYKNII